MDCIVHGVAKSRARLSDFRFTSQLRLLLFLQKTFRDHPVSAKQPPVAATTLSSSHTPKPSIAHARCQRKTIQKQTAPEHPSVTLPRPWLCRLYRRSSREEAVLRRTGQKPPPPQLSPFRNCASWAGCDARLRAGARGARRPSGVKRRALLRPPLGRSFWTAKRKVDSAVCDRCTYISRSCHQSTCFKREKNLSKYSNSVYSSKKVCQSCTTLCDRMDCSTPGSSVHGDSPSKNTGVSCHALLQGIFPTQGLNPCLWL
ncbi:uncharacterized protein LOC112579995 [Bubalus bubalis]|uniref:uncharacterized protein LOC112579995 n=1 Tax=Bubalus bubalis TaxID=89462 RepID=UPI001D12322C|nr:uncharacterized protein LOC112579995 [Bubalus bubalis]